MPSHSTDSHTCTHLTREQAEAWIQEENARVNNYMHVSTLKKLIDIVDDELVRRHATTLVDMEGSGCLNMLKEKRQGDLKLLYKLFGRVPEKLELVRDKMEGHISSLGKGMVESHELLLRQPVKFVDEVLELMQTFEDIVKHSFDEDKAFSRCYKKAVEFFLNIDVAPAQALVSYADSLFKKGLRGKTDEEIER